MWRTQLYVNFFVILKSGPGCFQGQFLCCCCSSVFKRRRIINQFMTGHLTPLLMFNSGAQVFGY